MRCLFFFFLDYQKQRAPRVSLKLRSDVLLMDQFGREKKKNQLTYRGQGRVPRQNALPHSVDSNDSTCARP
ncbi:hypothetical protein H369_031195, partial [Burkholderia pseudomallei OB]|uniref:hypothetical protein n=1 Tax=Burkholderia pseudomallei TaxID=28450 RepID=UPI001E47B633